jgi:hypothetical protein
LGDQDIWLECTSQDIPFGFLGDFTDDRKVLVIDENGGKIKKTDSYITEDNYQNIQADIELHSDGNLFADFKVISTGTQFDNKYFLEEKPKTEIIKYYKSYYDHLKNLNIESFDFTNVHEHVEFEEIIRLNASNYASKFGNRLMFIPNVLNQTVNIPDNYEPRVTPFTISRGYLDEDKLIFQLPEGMQIESMPKPVDISSKFGEYSAGLSTDDEGKLIYERKMLLNKGDFTREEYMDFRAFMIAVNKADQSKVILVKKT